MKYDIPLKKFITILEYKHTINHIIYYHISHLQSRYYERKIQIGFIVMHMVLMYINLYRPPSPLNLPDIAVSSHVTDGNAHTYQWRVSYFTYPSPNNACHGVYSR